MEEHEALQEILETEATESTESTESTEATEATESTESTEATEAAESTEAAEVSTEKRRKKKKVIQILPESENSKMLFRYIFTVFGINEEEYHEKLSSGELNEIDAPSERTATGYMVGDIEVICCDADGVNPIKEGANNRIYFSHIRDRGFIRFTEDIELLNGIKYSKLQYLLMKKNHYVLSISARSYLEKGSIKIEDSHIYSEAIREVQRKLAEVDLCIPVKNVLKAFSEYGYTSGMNFEVEDVTYIRDHGIRVFLKGKNTDTETETETEKKKKMFVSIQLEEETCYVHKENSYLRCNLLEKMSLVDLKAFLHDLYYDTNASISFLLNFLDKNFKQIWGSL